MTGKNIKLLVLFIIGCIGITVVAVGTWMFGTGMFSKYDKFCKGVTISGIDVGGLTKSEGEKKVDDYIAKLKQREVIIKIDDNEVSASADSLGFSCTKGNVIDKAYSLGKSGNVFERYKTIPKSEKKKGAFTLKSSVDEEKLQIFVDEHCRQFDVKAKNSKLKLKNGAFVATKSRKGRELKVEETVAVVSHDLEKNISLEPLTISAVVDVTEPKYTKKQVSKCKDLLGSYSTSYASSISARKANVKNAADYINGTIVYPGKVFSVIKTIKDRTEANGYQVASEYSSGKVVDGVGGGVCQVSTTLYNAVINAELEVVERSPHSMVVSYVDVSRDAAISGNYKDFKFKNNTEVPIYISAYADGATLSFKIYGEETRDENRKIEFKTEILETIQPGNPVETVDKTKPASYRQVTQSAHVGYKAKLWKIIYTNGKRTGKELVNSSTYSAEPQYITIGQKQEVKATATPTPSAENEKTKATKEPTAKATKKPEATKAPVVTKKPEEEPSATNSAQ